MKGIRNKKGFTLIELLAVIVVLAIVMVLATTTVLPYMANARKDSFALEVNTAKEAASQAVSLIMIGSVKDKYTTIKNAQGETTGYCISIENLKALGLFDKDDSNYQGVVNIEKNNGVFTYKIQMKNADFFVKEMTGEVKSNHVGDKTDADYAKVVTSCSAS